MSYSELEHGYQGLRNARPAFYIGLDLAAQMRRPMDEESDDGEETPEKQVVVGVCAMAKKSLSKPMKEILSRLEEFEYLKVVVFSEQVILKEPVENWPPCDCLISFHSKGFPLDKAREYAELRKPYVINNLQMQYDIQDRRKVYAILGKEGIEIPRYAVLNRDGNNSSTHGEIIESEDHVEVNGVIFNKPFVEKPVSAEDHNIYIYYPTSAGGGSQRLFRKIGSRSSVYSPESRVRKTGSFIYEDFMPTDGTDVKVYTVGPDYAHAEARKSPALDGKVERDSEGKEIRYPVILSNNEKLISRKVCMAFKQTVCGFDLLRANGKSFVCDVNGFSFVKNSNKYYDDSAKILGNMILRELAPTLHIPWSVPFQLDDPPIVPTTFGKMMELRCVVAVIRHGDRTPKQKMKVEVRHPKFFEVFEKYDGYKKGHVKLKRPTQLQEILDIARFLLNEIQHSAADSEIEEKQGKLEQLKSVLEMYGHFSGINRKVQMKYQPKGRPRGSSSDDDMPKEPSLVLILKWGGELTPAGRIQAEELGRIFRCMYPGGQGRQTQNGEYAGTQGLGLLRLHSTYRHDLKIYASDEGRVQMTAAAFAKGLLALEGELTPILVQMVKSANTNGLLDNDCDASKYQTIAKARLHELMQQEREITSADRELLNPCDSISIATALDFVKNPAKCCEKVQDLIQKLMAIVKNKRDDPKCKDAILYHGETWELMHRRWGKIDKDFCTKNKTFDISKIPDIYDCIKYDLQHNQHTLQFEFAEELYTYAKYLADIVIPQEYGLTVAEKLAIGQGICTPLLKKIRADLQRNLEESGEESVNRLNPRYSHGVSSPGRHVRTRLYFTSESHVHSLLTMIRFGHLLSIKDDQQWKRAMEYVSTVSELNYMSQIVIMLYEDPTKDPTSEERFHVELHFSPGVNCCVQKNLPPGPGFRPHSRNESNAASLSPVSDRESQSSHQSVEDLTQLEILNKSGENSQPSNAPTSPPVVNLIADKPDSILPVIPTIEMDYRPDPRTSGKEELSINSKCEAEIKLTSPVPIATRGHFEKRPDLSALAKDLTERLNRCLQDEEPRSRSFDHPRDIAPTHKSHRLKHQSLEAVNQEESTPVWNIEKLEEIDESKLIDCIFPSSLPIAIPRTVPLYLESTNDILPDSPSLKYLQISPENYASSRNFPEVTLSNLVAVNKSPKQEIKKPPKQETKTKKETKKSGSIPSDFMYCDGAFSGRVRKISDSNPVRLIKKTESSLLVPGPFLSSPCMQPEVPKKPENTPVAPAETPSRHRHSVAGHHSYRQNWAYFQLYGISVGPSGGVFFHPNRNKLLGSSNSLFSTAVISGSSSAPNLRDTIVNSQTLTAFESCGGVPAIRPLETLHNALSLKQLDNFLSKVTCGPLYKTPASTPPMHPSTPQPFPGNSWSGASSLTSIPSPKMFRSLSSGSNSGFEERTSATQSEQANPGLVEDLGQVILLENLDYDNSSVEFRKAKKYKHKSRRDSDGRSESGESTPVSLPSELEYESQELETREITEMERCFETDNEDDDGERTITKNVDAARESIVGFFPTN